MPTTMIDNNFKIVLYNTSLGMVIAQQAAMDYTIIKQNMFTSTQSSKW